MKNAFPILGMTLLCISVLHAQDFSPEDTVIRFFQASQKGNIEEMKSLVAGSFYNRRKVLLDNNSTYPNFLIEHYKGSSVEIEKSITDTNQGTAAVTVTVNFPENKKDRYRYILKKYQNGHWKIVRQDQR